MFLGGLGSRKAHVLCSRTAYEAPFPGPPMQPNRSDLPGWSGPQVPLSQVHPGQFRRAWAGIWRFGPGYDRTPGV